MPNTIITQTGLEYATSASPWGPLVAIKYFVPVYDYRSDPDLHNGTDTSALDVSASMAYTDTEPTGEIIWNIDEDTTAYSLSTNDDWCLYTGSETIASAGTDWDITDAVQSKFQPVNLYESAPLSSYISGTDIDLSAGSGDVGVYNAGFIKGDNDVPTETSASTGRYFPITHFYPVSSGGSVRGSFKCRLTKNIGRVKFNKIALYAMKVNAAGTEIDALPTLFAEAGLTNSVIKNNFGTEGFDDIVIDVQIQLDTLTSAWGDVYYSTSGDYWASTPGGLYYPE